MPKEDEQHLGILLYGYVKAQAEEIGQVLSPSSGRAVEVIGATGRENETVEDIIENPEFGAFGERETKMLMFLGFDDEAVGNALRMFPRSMPRPIFCTLTENNVHWKLSTLIEHLLEEKALWERRERNGQ